jgi:glycosyltransferase involved in cell wall biosynthesis
MACGTPVITSNVSSMPEVAGDSALLVNPYDVAEIAAAMRAIAEETPLRQELAAQGIARSAQFQWAKTSQLALTILQRYL